jgi:hypothetical protein
MSALNNQLIYGAKSTWQAGSVLRQADFIPKLIRKLQEEPEAVIADFEEIRSYRVSSLIYYETYVSY